MDAFVQLLGSGALSLLDMVLIAIVGLLTYFVTVKQKSNETNINETVEGMKTLLAEERTQTEKLSKVVYEMKKEMKAEQEKNFALREEILVLKQENMRLQTIVTQMEELIKHYQEELANAKKGGEQ